MLLPRRDNAPVADAVAPGNPDAGHHAALHAAAPPAAGRRLDFPVVATSGNLSDEPICTDEREAFERLGAHRRRASWSTTAPSPATSTTACSGSSTAQPQSLAPGARLCAAAGAAARDPLPTILAVGAHLKNTRGAERRRAGLHQPAHRRPGDAPRRWPPSSASSPTSCASTKPRPSPSPTTCTRTICRQSGRWTAR